jgi:hypothetical protein
MKWVTRERPRIDRIACPWLVARFIDDAPEFLFVSADAVHRVAADTGAIPFDVAGAELTHIGDCCSFDAFLDKYRLHRPALDRLAVIIRGADTGHLELSPECAGLYAISKGLARHYADDWELLKHGMVMYDALYIWCECDPGTEST